MCWECRARLRTEQRPGGSVSHVHDNRTEISHHQRSLWSSMLPSTKHPSCSGHLHRRFKVCRQRILKLPHARLLQTAQCGTTLSLTEGYPATSLHVLSIAFPAKVSATSSQAITSKPVAVKQELEWPAPLYLEFSLG